MVGKKLQAFVPKKSSLGVKTIGEQTALDL
jgi:hypothetical protein